jgi:uncharacterized FlaG/YvyC family protein
MVDQLSPLASGLPTALLAAALPKAHAERPRPARTADSQSPGRSDTAKLSEAALEQLNGYLQHAGSDIKFQMDEDSGRTFFKIVSQTTGEVLLQVPSVEVMAMARKSREFADLMEASGHLVDKEG